MYNINIQTKIYVKDSFLNELMNHKVRRHTLTNYLILLLLCMIFMQYA